jgi:hypothetical protein
MVGSKISRYYRVEQKISNEFSLASFDWGRTDTRNIRKVRAFILPSSIPVTLLSSLRQVSSHSHYLGLFLYNYEPLTVEKCLDNHHISRKCKPSKGLVHMRTCRFIIVKLACPS